MEIHSMLLYAYVRGTRCFYDGEKIFQLIRVLAHKSLFFVCHLGRFFIEVHIILQVYEVDSESLLNEFVRKYPIANDVIYSSRAA